MRKDDTTSVPSDERNKITDVDILLLCEYSKELLLDLLFYKEIEKEISDIKFVLSLMIKNGNTSVPSDERNKITDVNILLLCEYGKASLLEQLFDKEKRLFASRQAMHTIASSGKLSYIISVSHYYFMVFIYHITESKVGEVSCAYLQSTYELLLAGKLQNQFIEFENDLQLLTFRSAIKRIYVRESYETVTALISDAMTKKNIKNFVVTGTPGIGKTIYLHYFLWVLISRQTNINNNVDRKIYLQCDNYGIYSFRGNKVVPIDAREARGTFLCDLNCILLVDMVHEDEPMLCAGTTIVFSSPNRKRYKQLVKAISRQYIFNCWTLKELKAVWLRSYRDIPWEDVEGVYNKMGGVIRYVLEQNDAADEAMAAGVSKARRSLIGICQTMHDQTFSGNDDVLIYRVVHLYSPDHSKGNSTIVFASDYAREICLQGLNIEQRNNMIAFLKYNTALDPQGYRGHLFEVHAHKAVAEHGLENIRRLRNAEYKDTKSNSLLRTYCLPASYNLVFNGSISKAPTKFADLSSLVILKNVYCQPDKMDFASIDSFAIVDNDVLAFQVTVGSKKNGIKASGLGELYEAVNKTFPNLHYHIIFLCAAGEENSMNSEAVKISSTGNKIYKYFANIPENVRRFEGNQWISEIEMNLLLDCKANNSIYVSSR